MAVQKQIGSFWKDLPFKGYLYASLVLIVFTLAVILIARNFLPPVVPLLYGRPEGAGQLVNSLGLLIAPAATFVIALINIILSGIIKQVFIQKVLIISTFLISVLTAITVLKIVFLVGMF